ncbi:MAG: ribonuclease III [bacterium]
MNNYNDLEEVIGYKFKNLDHINLAFTHSSYANEHYTKSNETMEFLGDSVLDLCIGHYLFKNVDIDEGEMTKLRASYVCEEALAFYANKINLSKYLKLGNGEELLGGRTRQALIADAFEAMLGAVFLDSSFDECDKVVNKVVIPYLQFIDILDYKSKLQELMQADKRTIVYDIINDEGPAHNKTFEAEVKLENNIVLGRGKGKTKKEAEQHAAKAALSKIAK